MAATGTPSVRPLDAATIAHEAGALLQAQRQATPISPLTERHPGVTDACAYAIQRKLIGLRVAGGARVIGRKIGLTTTAMQEILGVDRPDHGVLLDEMRLEATAGIDSRTLIAPRAECEIAFQFGRDLEGPDVDVEEVLAATECFRPALEIIDCRIADWRIRYEDTVADNAASALVILGAATRAEVDLVRERATIAAGDRTADGDGSAVLGNPARAVTWLLAELAKHGEGLRKGDVVIPGALAPALPIHAGDTVVATYSTLGELRVQVR
jgi:2-keto-4-pentenoate hydratase